ncbi:molybdenum cofactor guanylyltransferase [Flavobacteriaceae bacterium XHP0103]|uniref:molybdenum cofactor guanylyltransferase n=1 Tax=Marixanthotalea marina TaxID=2844359 RepID=UPI002989FE33|nr:molybdenum cofactor guanylyltransferase [Marixanthotalea marina]MBU3821651.1 molybdenum cofactor guanylyltransferase [Marixanthotalea marina]
MKKITAIILAGGKSSRMGTDKGFLTLNNKWFVQHIIDAAKPLVNDFIIVSDDNEYDIFNYNRITDCIKEAGPLAGIYTGLKHTKTNYNLVLSCDIPLINSTVLNKLIDAMDDCSEVIQIESLGRTMPLIALYKKQCEHKFLELLNQGERRLQYAVNHCQFKNVVIENEKAMFTKNINTPKELNEITE